VAFSAELCLHKSGLVHLQTTRTLLPLRNELAWTSIYLFQAPLLLAANHNTTKKNPINIPRRERENKNIDFPIRTLLTMSYGTT
jgi:hypothetical protein